eukprot:6195289-Pleurochrysis_carterae.AAC.1
MASSSVRQPVRRMLPRSAQLTASTSISKAISAASSLIASNLLARVRTADRAERVRHVRPVLVPDARVEAF